MLANVKEAFMHSSLDTKIILTPTYIDYDQDHEPTWQGMQAFQSGIPEENLSKGTVHMLLTNEGSRPARDMNARVCSNNNRYVCTYL